MALFCVCVYYVNDTGVHVSSLLLSTAPSSVSTSLYLPALLCSYLLDGRYPGCLLPVTTDDFAANLLVTVALRRREMPRT